MEKLLFTDNADSTMSGTLSNGGTTLVLSASTGSLFPNPGAGEAFIVTLFEINGSSEEEFIEKAKCTGRTADTLTIARDVDGAVLAAGGPASGGYAYPSSPERTVYVQLRWVSLAANEMLTAAVVHATTTKATPVDADELPIIDSAASNVLKNLTWANLKATLFASWGALIAASTSKTTPVDADGIALGDSAASNATKKLTWANLKATLWASLGALIAAGTAKTTPVDGDGIAIADSAASSATKYLTLTNLWTNLFKGKADALYAPIAKGVTNGDSHDHSGGAGAQIAYSGLSGLPTLGTAAAKNTGASGDAVPLCNVANTFSAAQSVQGNLLVTSAAGIGYGTGAGGTVTQATSKSTAVTLNKPCGQITMNNAALGAGVSVAFNLSNSLFSASDLALVTVSNNGNYIVYIPAVFAGGCSIKVTNITAGTLSEAVVLNFAIIKGATS